VGIDVKVKDGGGSGRLLEVDRNHSIPVTVTGFPAKDGHTSLRPYVDFMKTSAGSNDMSVNASLASPEDFIIGADSDYDRHILTISFTLTDDTVKLKEFGHLAALTNGCQLFYKDDEIGSVTIHDSITSNYELVQMCLFNPSFGNGADVFKAKDIDAAKADAYIPVLDIRSVFGLTYGIKIPAGSSKRIIFRVRDDISTLGRFDAKVFGYDVIPTGK